METLGPVPPGILRVPSSPLHKGCVVRWTEEGFSVAVVVRGRRQWRRRVRKGWKGWRGGGRVLDWILEPSRPRPVPFSKTKHLVTSPGINLTVVKCRPG